MWFDVVAQERCDEIVENILSGVESLRSKCEINAMAHWSKFQMVCSRLCLKVIAIASVLAYWLPQKQQGPETLFEC